MTIEVEKQKTDGMSFREKSGIYHETMLRAQHGLITWGIDAKSFLTINNDINSLMSRIWTLFPLAALYNEEDNAKENFELVLGLVKKDFNGIIEALVRATEKETKTND